jgi:predicted MFS family arabinose efflux permease
LALSVFVLLAVVESLVVGISPLLPAYESRLSLTGFSVSALLASTSLALLLAGVPAGLIADRIGVRRITLLAGMVLCLASFAEADPVGYGYLLVDRIIVGAAAGVFWTTGLAWLAALPQGHSSALGIGITMAGVGLVFGPGFVGLVAQALGLGAPFIVIGAFIAVTTLILAYVPYQAVPVADGVFPPRLSTVLVAAKQRPELRSALIALSGSAVAAGAISIVLPLELHQAGASTGTIGLILFATGLGFIGASSIIARAGWRVVNSRGIVIATALVGTLLLPGSLSRSAAILTVTVALVTPFRGALTTLCYQLAPQAAGDGVGAASIIGFLNSLWGAVSVVSPLAAGAIFDAAGGRAAFAFAQAIVLMAAVATALSWRGPRVRRMP